MGYETRNHSLGRHHCLWPGRPDGEKIKGSELQFELFTSQFQGIVTETGPDYVDFTVRGTTVVDKMLEVETRVTELDGACD